jgi:hypothetical protein
VIGSSGLQLAHCTRRSPTFSEADISQDIGDRFNWPGAPFGRPGSIKHPDSYTVSGGPIGDVSHAYLWDAETGVTDLGTLGGLYSGGTGINNLGQVAGTSSVTLDPIYSPDHAFLKMSQRSSQP